MNNASKYPTPCSAMMRDYVKKMIRNPYPGPHHTKLVDSSRRYRSKHNIKFQRNRLITFAVILLRDTRSNTNCLCFGQKPLIIMYADDIILVAPSVCVL